MCGQRATDQIDELQVDIIHEIIVILQAIYALRGSRGLPQFLNLLRAC